MSAPLKSFDPATQAIYEAIANHDNTALPGLLDQWLATPRPANDGAFFFQACCKKQGAGLVRILVGKGLKSNQDALDLALERKCWHVAHAMVPAMVNLWPPAETFHGPEAPAALLTALLAGQVELARALLPLYPDPSAAANAALHHLARTPGKTAEEACLGISWLVSQGADPNQRAVRQTHPLEAALSARNAKMALELVRSGASFGFPHPMAKVVCCALGCRVDHPQHLETPRISAEGWDLVETALGCGFRAPQMLKTPWNTHYVEGTDRTTSQLHPEDVARFHVMIESALLDKTTPPAASPSRGPRL